MATYGHFDDKHREFVVTRPDTPLPWLNMLGQDEFFGLCTQTAGGYTFWKEWVTQPSCIELISLMNAIPLLYVPKTVLFPTVAGF